VIATPAAQSVLRHHEKVDVLGEALDDPVSLTQARAALEDDPGAFNRTKDAPQNLDDPDVLLYVGRRDAESVRRGSNQPRKVGRSDELDHQSADINVARRVAVRFGSNLAASSRTEGRISWLRIRFLTA